MARSHHVKPDAVFDGATKGLPAGEVRLAQIASRRWRLLAEDLPLPAAVLKESALAGNSRWMSAFLHASGAKLAPHLKTHMSPELMGRQLKDGAWGITVADARQMRVALRGGARRIVIANEQAGAADLAAAPAALAADPELEVFVLVDSLEGLARLAASAAAQLAHQPVNVLVEIGYAGGRGGCRDLPSALAVARRAAETPGLALAGVEAFEGLNQGLPPAEGVTKVRELLSRVGEAARAMDEARLFARPEAVLSAGGSAFFDLAAEMLGEVRLSRRSIVLLRSGCYLSHDVGLYERAFRELDARSEIARGISGRLQNALEVWAYVLSAPEPGRAILGAGRRDVGCDAGLPTPLKQFRPGRDEAPRPIDRNWEIAAANDQHTHLTFPADADVAFGDMIALGPSHPCSTFDRWRLIHLVDDAYAVTGAVQTFF